MMTYPVFRLLINNWKCSCLVYKTICDGSQMGFWFHYLIMYETSSLFLITELVVFKVCNRLSVIYFTSWNREQGKKKFGAESRYGWVCVLLLFIFEMTRHVKPASSETFQCWKRKFLIFIPGIYTDTAIVDRCLLLSMGRSLSDWTRGSTRLLLTASLALHSKDKRLS